MSFFAKIKSFLGIGGLKASFDLPASYSKEETVLNGKIILTTKQDQEVESYKMWLTRELETGRDENKRTKRTVLGRLEVQEGFTIAANESKEVPFTLEYALKQTDNESLKEQGGMMAGLGKLGSFMDNEKITYILEARFEVKGSIGESVKKEITIA